MLADVVVGLSYGDEGKGKVTHHLLKTGDYTHCIRYNGGCNAGHTIYHNNKKFITHHIPAGVFFGIKSIIGSGCVVNLEQFNSEIRMLHAVGIQTKGLVFIAENAHIITDEHLKEDRMDTRIGTTKQGNGPAYRDKYDRCGMLARNHTDLVHSGYLINMYEELYNGDTEPVILFEGAQGFGLDVDWGDYPYVTSSHCTTAGALLNGVPPQAIRNVFGVAKAYDTYVGAKRFQGKSTIFSRIQELGSEFGATTGRPRQCNWLNINNLRKAANMNGANIIIVNKIDILREAGKWAVIQDENEVFFMNETEWTDYVESQFPNIQVRFSDSPKRI